VERILEVEREREREREREGTSAAAKPKGEIISEIRTLLNQTIQAYK
jgi:hypothetical protein